MRQGATGSPARQPEVRISARITDQGDCDLPRSWQVACCDTRGMLNRQGLQPLISIFAMFVRWLPGGFGVDSLALRNTGFNSACFVDRRPDSWMQRLPLARSGVLTEKHSGLIRIQWLTAEVPEVVNILKKEY
jgi:hypothetical protein